MNFVSLQFLAFLVVCYAVHWGLRSGAGRRRFLVAASYLFYAAWDWRFCGLMLFVTVNAYLAGRALASGKAARKAVLWASIAIDLVVLCAFKYFGFFAGSLNSALQWTGLSLSVPLLQVILPVGISFYTFHAISYVVDVYRGKVPAEADPLKVALYVSFFPQLIAGPIVRASFFMPQLRRSPPASSAQHGQGVVLFVRGFVYKAVLADTLAQICDPIYAAVSTQSAHQLAVAAFAFYGQIYFDFAGYSLMAIGTARLFGYRFPKNFDYPYASASMTEFWRRWHMSLSFWLRDYVYIPLGGSRGGAARRYGNLMATMLLGGLWHGAAWTFVAWGFIHGLGLCLHKLWASLCGRSPVLRERGSSALYGLAAILLTQAWVLVGWVFFRAQSFSDAWTVLKALFSRAAYRGITIADPIVWIVIVVLIDLALGLGSRWGSGARAVARPALWLGLGVVTAVALTILPQAQKSFIYFQF